MRTGTYRRDGPLRVGTERRRAREPLLRLWLWTVGPFTETADGKTHTPTSLGRPRPRRGKKQRVRTSSSQNSTRLFCAVHDPAGNWRSELPPETLEVRPSRPTPPPTTYLVDPFLFACFRRPRVSHLWILTRRQILGLLSDRYRPHWRGRTERQDPDPRSGTGLARLPTVGGTVPTDFWDRAHRTRRGGGSECPPSARQPLLFLVPLR